MPLQCRVEQLARVRTLRLRLPRYFSESAFHLAGLICLPTWPHLVSIRGGFCPSTTRRLRLDTGGLECIDGVACDQRGRRGTIGNAASPPQSLAGLGLIARELHGAGHYDLGWSVGGFVQQRSGVGAEETDGAVGLPHLLACLGVEGNNGLILAQGSYEGGPNQYVELSRAPEPGTFILAGAALLLAALARRSISLRSR